jgi:plasmid stabilization system protein ParE
MNVRFTRRARADLEGIFGYLNNKSPRGARHVLAAIHASIKVIEDHPLASLVWRFRNSPRIDGEL